MSASVNASLVKLRVPLALGSRSPRRLELLASVGVAVVPCVADVDETPEENEDPRRYVQRIACAKLMAARGTLAMGLPGVPAPVAVLVADTTVTIDGAILGKPIDDDQAMAMLTRLAGRTHEVLTCYGLALASEEVVRTVATRVSMRACSTATIASYVKSGEPFGKAGAYAIQGLGAALIDRIEGSYTAVVGLPLAEVLTDLARLGVAEPLA